MSSRVHHPFCRRSPVGRGWRSGGAWLVWWTLSLTLLAAPVRWHWSNPLPHGNNITDLAFRTNRFYVQVADHGQLYTSTDLGRWEPRETGTRKALRGAAFLGTRLLVSGEAGLILWADDPQEIHQIDLGTGDWLEGIATSTNRAVAVGDNGAIYLSDDGTNWIRQPVEFDTWLRGVAWGGGIFVAVGELGRIYTSPDGTEWTLRKVERGTFAELNRAAWTGNGFVVAGDAFSGQGTVIFGDATGTSWSRQTNSGALRDLLATAAESSTSRLLVGDQEARLVTGNTTTVWSNQSAPALTNGVPPAVYLGALWDGERFVLGGRSGVTVIGERSPPILGRLGWTPFPSPPRNWLFDVTTATSSATNVSAFLTNGAVAYSSVRTTNQIFVAAGDFATVLNSDDGVEWAPALVPASASNRTYLGVGGNARGLLAAGGGGTLSFSPVRFAPLITTNRLTNGAVVIDAAVTNEVNTLGFAWYATDPATALDLQAVCATPDLYVVGGEGGFLATSPDGTNWTRQASGTTKWLSGLETWSGGLVAVGDEGTILTSSDAITWTPRTSGTSAWIYRVRAAQDQLVAVGENGTLLTSSDAVNWTARPTGLTNWLNDVEFVAGTWFAVGNQGTVLTSTNAIDWTPDANLITGKSLYGVTARDGRLITVGIEGVILRTQVGGFPNPVTILEFPRTPEEQLFLFAGETDQRFRLDAGPALTNLPPGPVLEITHPSGTLIYYLPTTNDPGSQFFAAPDVP